MGDVERKPIGDLIDTLGVTVALPDGVLVSSALVLLSVVDRDGGETVKAAWSEGQSWVARRGLLEVARDSERIPPTKDDD
jgi:hypothetical protein